MITNYKEYDYLMEALVFNDISDATIIRGARMDNEMDISGIYEVKCFDSEGKLLWEDEATNLVTTVGKNYLFDVALRNTGYAAGFIGLISSVSWTQANVTDSMATHTQWFETNGTYYPTITIRQTATFGGAAAGGSITSSAATFAIGTPAGTIKGCFLVMGTSASSALGNTGGVLYSAGTFTGGDKTVGNGDSVQVTYVSSIS
jgi:hypothetical protein